MTNATVFPMGLGGVDSVTAVGTTRAGSPTLTAGMNNLVTAGGAVAVTLPLAGVGSPPVSVFVGTATTATVFPPASGGKIQGGSADAAFSVATLKTAIFVPISATDWAVVLSA